MQENELKALLKTAEIPLDEGKCAEKHEEESDRPAHHDSYDKPHVPSSKKHKHDQGEAPSEKKNDNNPDYDTTEEHD